jgi:hypothetical protein
VPEVASQVCEKRRFKALLEPCFGSTGLPGFACGNARGLSQVVGIATDPRLAHASRPPVRQLAHLEAREREFSARRRNYTVGSASSVVVRPETRLPRRKVKGVPSYGFGFVCAVCGRRGQRAFVPLASSGTVRAYRCVDRDACEKRRMTRYERKRKRGQ